MIDRRTFLIEGVPELVQATGVRGLFPLIRSLGGRAESLGLLLL